MDTWFDKRGNVHVNINPKTDDSENSPLFTAEYCLLSDAILQKKVNVKASKDYVRKRLDSFWNEENQRFHADTSSDNINDHFSHDNMTGIACMAYAFNIPEYIDKIKIWGYWHPRDMLFYSYLKGHYWAKWFIWLIILVHIVSCLSPYEDTSGKWLAITRNLTLMRRNCWAGKISHWINTKIINAMYKNGWADVGKIYFRNEGHPNRELIDTYNQLLD